MRNKPYNLPTDLPFLPTQLLPSGVALNDEECRALWDKYAMFPNIRRHSMLVAHIATQLAERAVQIGLNVSVPHVRASALLHDLAKSYSILYGGGHAQLGASWVIEETGNYVLAQGVMLHVYWPWAIPKDKEACQLALLVMYADKRAKHDTCVTLEERYNDILARYGDNPASCANIRFAREQGEVLEAILTDLLQWDIHEDTFNSRGLVL